MWSKEKSVKFTHFMVRLFYFILTVFLYYQLSFLQKAMNTKHLFFILCHFIFLLRLDMLPLCALISF